MTIFVCDLDIRHFFFFKRRSVKIRCACTKNKGRVSCDDDARSRVHRLANFAMEIEIHPQLCLVSFSWRILSLLLMTRSTQLSSRKIDYYFFFFFFGRAIVMDFFLP